MNITNRLTGIHLADGVNAGAQTDRLARGVPGSAPRRGQPVSSRVEGHGIAWREFSRGGPLPRGPGDSPGGLSNIHSSGETLGVLRCSPTSRCAADFGAARDRLLNQPPDILVTNVRLQELQRLHLVHLSHSSTRDDRLLGARRKPRPSLARCRRRAVLERIDAAVALPGGLRARQTCRRTIPARWRLIESASLPARRPPFCSTPSEARPHTRATSRRSGV